MLFGRMQETVYAQSRKVCPRTLELIRIPAKDFELHSDHYLWEVVQTIEILKVA